MAASVTRRAPAKINLALDILGRRADGFHAIETVFQTIGLCDEVTVALVDGDQVRMTCSDPSLPCGPDNLVWKAAVAYLARRPLGGVAIDLLKRIPHGAGLGGGSSDAAAVLLALRDLDPAPPPASELHAMAVALGSDVPFFLVGGTAHATGRGEELTRLPDLPPLPITICMPDGGHCPTPAVYKALTDPERGPRPARGVAWWTAACASVRTPSDLGALLHNRMTAAAIRVCPAVGGLIGHLEGQGIPCLMSGSGAACFALGAVDVPPATRVWTTALLPG